MNAVLIKAAGEIDQARQLINLAARKLDAARQALIGQPDKTETMELHYKADQCAAALRLTNQAHDGIGCIDTKALLGVPA